MLDTPDQMPSEVVGPRRRNARQSAPKAPDPQSGPDARPSIEAVASSTSRRKRGETRQPPRSRDTPFTDNGTNPLGAGPLSRKAMRGTGTTAPTSEVGVTGLNVQAGYIRDNVDPRFHGVRWRKTLVEMGERSPIIGGIESALTAIVRQSEWLIVDASDKKKDVDAGQLVRTAIFEDMNQPWGSTLAEICSMFRFGWSYFEIVFKRRLGQDPPAYKDGSGQRIKRTPSKFDDGKWGIKKLAPRSQQTLDTWALDEAGGIKGMIQLAPPTNEKRWLPIERCLLFRPLAYRNNPEGRSIFTNAYDSWYYMTRLQLAEAIGSERNLVGVPTMGVPMRIMLADADPAEKQLFEELGEVLGSFKRDERSFLMYPLAYDKDGNPLFKWDLTRGSGGGPAADTRAMIEAHKQDIALSALASFILTGMEGTGAFNLADARMDHFVAAVKSYIEAIIEVVNLYLIPRLLRLNGIKTTTPPKMQAGKIRPFDLNELGTFIQRISASGAEFFPSRTLEDALLAAAGLPIPKEEDRPKPGEGNRAKGNANQQINDAPPGGQAPSPRKRGGAAKPTAPRPTQNTNKNQSAS